MNLNEIIQPQNPFRQTSMQFGEYLSSDNHIIAHLRRIRATRRQFMMFSVASALEADHLYKFDCPYNMVPEIRKIDFIKQFANLLKMKQFWSRNEKLNLRPRNYGLDLYVWNTSYQSLPGAALTVATRSLDSVSKSSEAKDWIKEHMFKIQYDAITCIFHQKPNLTVSADVRKLARQIFEDESYEGMPVLADMLEEGGCTNAMVLNHCRQANRHCAGCFVLDDILGYT